MANPNQNARRGDLVNRSPQSKAGALKQVVWSKIALFVSVSFFTVKANAWTNGELSIWMDPDRAHALEPIVKRFTDDSGIKIKIESRKDWQRTLGWRLMCPKVPTSS